MGDDNPTLEHGAAVRFQLTGPIFNWVENFRRAQTRIPSRAEAVRRLLEQAREVEESRSAEQAARRRA
jgi:hypothetical protein